MTRGRSPSSLTPAEADRITLSTPLEHEVAPKAAALGCAACHGGGHLDFAALGYACSDPATGGCAKRP